LSFVSSAAAAALPRGRSPVTQVESIATTPDTASAANALTPDPITTATATAPAAAPAPASAALAPAEPAKPAIEPNELQLPRPEPLRTRAAEPQKLKGQIAVLVSRKEKRIFVRHAFVPLFDMPVEIANPDYPIGHHVYTALEVNGEGMRWNVITMPRPVPPAASAANATNAKNAKGAKQRNVRQKRVPPYDPRTPSDATEALDRITIPQEALDRIAEVLVPGSSLIISDEGLGRETGRYTEFIVETR
jgi:hypothetical protein